LAGQPAPDAHSALGSLRDGVCIVAPDWRIRYANASLLEILHLVGQDRPVERVWDVLPEGSGQAALLRAAMQTREPVSFRLPGPGGAHVLQFEVEPDGGGDLRVRCRNVTGQARMEDLERRWREATLSLAEREARLDAVLEGSPVGLVLLDAASLTVVEANRSAHDLLEGRWRTPGSTVGHAFGDFIPGWAEGGVDELMRRVRDTREPVAEEEREFLGYDRPRWFRWSMHPVGGGDGPARYLLLAVVEVTESALARRALEAEHRALYDVLDSLPVGLVVAEAPDGRTGYINPAAAALGGRPPDELASANAGEYADRWRTFRPTGEPFPAAELPSTRALAGEAVREQEVVLRPVDGPERTVLTTAIPLRAGDGGVERAVVSFYDVTDRLRLERQLLLRTAEAEAAAGEAALRAEESRALREMGRALVSVLEPRDVLTRAAEHALELLGARGSFVAMPGADGTFTLSPALGVLAAYDGQVRPLEGSMTADVMRSGEARVYNTADSLPPGSLAVEIARRQHLRNLLLVPMQAFGEPLGVLGAVDRELGFGGDEVRLLQALADSAALAVRNGRLYEGERRRAEENRALMAAAEALASTLEPGEVMQRIVEVARELVDADGAGLTAFVGPDRAQVRLEATAGFLSAFTGPATPREGSLSDVIARGGAPRVLRAGRDTDVPGMEFFGRLGIEEFAVLPLSVGGEQFGVLGVANRAGRRPLGEDDLRVLRLLGDQAALAVRNARMHEAARDASRAKSEFLAIMSHELRTPLNALAGYSSLLEEEIYGPLNEAQRGALMRMRGARGQLMELIDQVLEMARLEAGRREPEPADVALGPLVRDTAEALRGSAEAKGLAFTVEVEPVGTLRTDAMLVGHVVRNLVGNAVKFTREGGVTVRCREQGGEVRVEVSDTGPGIDPGLHERIFEPFFQADGSTTRRQEGTGLGLALSREFARLVGGEVTLASRPGGGSTFTLRLPRNPPAEVAGG
jgi:signal transduction histidine kinase/PAS domain-containing protein